MQPLLKSLGENLYFAEADVRFYGVGIQTRMTVAKLADGGLWVCSPLVLTPELAGELDRLGPVSHILSPNKIHNQGMSSFAGRYPEARLWASPGLEKRRSDLNFHGTLNDKAEPEWVDEFEQITTKGNVFFSEVVFFHKRTRTLIVSDLVENLCAETIQSRMGRAVAKAANIYGRPLPSPEFRAYTLEPATAKAQLDRISEWPFERIVLAHGEFITENAHDVFRAMGDFLTSEARSRPWYRRALYRVLSRLQ